ncbi:MAG: TOBE domain-containing protein, partial [Mycobacteriaceae bacterium]
LFYLRPPTLAAARFFGVTNELAGSVAAGRFCAENTGLAVATPVEDGPAVLVIRPESIQLLDDVSPSEGGSVEGLVRAARFAGTHLVLEVTLGGPQSLCVHVPVGATTPVGGRVRVRLPSEACTVFAEQPRPRQTARELGDEGKA